MAMSQSTLEILIKLRDETRSGLGAVESKLSGLGTTLGGVATKLGGFAASMVAAGAILGVKTASEIETARAGLITLLGSADEADKTIARLKDAAMRTPFEFTGLAQATQMLTSVTKDGQKSIDIIMDIGEALAAMGKGQPELDRIIVNLQQVGAIGYASMVDIKQFAYAGIPIFEMLQKETGKSGKALEDFISKGGVSFQMLTKMFDKANDEGGKFFNGFKNTAGTFDQSWSNMKDTVSQATASIVQDTGAFDLVKSAMVTLSEKIAKNKDTLREWSIAFKVVAQLAAESVLVIGTYVSKALNWIGVVSDETNASMRKALDDMTANIEKSQEQFNAIGSSTDDAKEKVADFGAVAPQAFANLGEEAEAAAEKIKDANKAVEETNRKIQELEEQHLQESKDSRAAFGRAVVDQEKLVKNLRMQMRDEEDSKARDKLEEEYTRQKDALERKKVLERVFSAEVQEARRRDALTDFEREVEDIKLRMTEQYKQHNEKMMLLKAELAENEAKRAKLNAIEVGTTADLKAQLATRTDTIKVFSDGQIKEASRVQTAWQSAFRYTSLVGGVSGSGKTSSGGSTKKVGDAIIKPSGEVITTSPKDWLIATTNPRQLAGTGSGLTINIGTVNGTDRTAAERFAAEIARAIKLQVRV